MTKKIIIISMFTAALLSFFACNEDSNVGMGILPDDALVNHSITDTFTLHTFTQSMDTMGGSGVNKLLLGKMTDPIFGFSEASSAVQITVGSYYNFSDSLTADSVYLNLAYNPTGLRAYGDSSLYQTVKVYRMRENIRYDSVYYTDRNPNELHNNELMGSVSFRTANNPDSMLRIRLNDEWADFFLHPEDESLYDYGEDFREYFNGFVLVTEEGNENASIVSLALTENSKLTVYHHFPADPDSAREANFPINEYCGRINMFTHDYTGTPIENTINSTENNDLVFIQGMSGLRMKVDIPFINTLSKIGNVAVFKAELIVETADNSGFMEDEYPAAPAMVVTGVNDEGGYYALPEYSAENAYQAELLSGTRQYRFDVGSYLQNILNGKQNNNGLYIYAAAGSQNFYRAVIKGAANDSPLKLIITYTIL